MKVGMNALAASTLEIRCNLYNRRFGKLPRDRHDAHRAVRKDEDLAAIFAWREYRKVTDSLTLRYERKMYSIQTGVSRFVQQGTHCPTPPTTKLEQLIMATSWTTSD
jgi:hypothetical protein